MQKLFSFVRITLIPFIFSILCISSAFAAPEFIQEDENFNPILVEKNITDDAYILGESIQTKGKIEGDAVFAGINITLEKDVTEDALLLGETVTVNGNISDDIRVFSHNIHINGNVGDDIITAGKNINIKNSHIGGTVIATGKNVNFSNNTTNEAVQISAEKIFFNSTATGLVSLSAKEITFGKNAKITGVLQYSGNTTFIAPDATLKSIVNGEITKKESEYEYNEFQVFEDQRMVIAGYLFSIVLFSFLLTLWIPKYFAKTTQHILSAPFSRFIAGIFWVIGAPLLSFMLTFTVIGFPFGITLFLFWGISLLLLPYLCTSVLASFFLKIFKWEGFFATLVVIILSAIISLTPLLLVFAPFILGGLLKEESEITKKYK